MPRPRLERVMCFWLKTSQSAGVDALSWVCFASYHTSSHAILSCSVCLYSRHIVTFLMMRKHTNPPKTLIQVFVLSSASEFLLLFKRTDGTPRRTIIGRTRNARSWTTSAGQGNRWNSRVQWNEVGCPVICACYHSLIFRLRDDLIKYLRPFAQEGKVVNESDIRDFFASLSEATKKRHN